ncbi:MAG: hypothetical protein GHCLOJNM_01463 [bacterium]|nr:hypothetical protein [bacterium]
MVDLNELAAAVLAHDCLKVRGLAQDLTRETADFSTLEPPTSADMRIRAVAASLIELFAQRAKQPPPTWSVETPGLGESIFLVESAGKMQRLRKLCEAESPEPLKKRGLLAPPNYLEFA